MAQHTSTELIEWMIVLDELEWHQTTRECQYLAQISAEVHNIGQMFAKSPKFTTAKDFFLKMENRVFDEMEVKTIKKKEKPQIEIGSEEAKNSPKWQAVTANAKMKWSMFLRKPIA